MATTTRTIPPTTEKELITLQEFVTIPTYLIRQLPQDKLYALMDLLSMADENGEFFVTQRMLMDRWKWGNTKVRNFIDYLIRKDICKPKTNHETNQKQTRVFIVNTEFFALPQTKNKPLSKPKTSQEKGTEDRGIYKRIIEHLNMMCGTRYRCESEDSIKFIRERLDEGFLEEDFYDVIDKKANEWLGTQWEQYLRPYTLFRKDKFENYLNQRVRKSQETQNINASRQSQLEYLLNSIREDEKNDGDGR